MRRFKKIYFEITDVCNLNCSFCHGTVRGKGFISVNDFRRAAGKLRPYSDYIYLHVMGEPLLHPALEEILSACRGLDYKTAITTNGTLLKEKGDMLISSGALYKVSVSLHAPEANGISAAAVSDYLSEVCSFAQKAADSGIIVSLRLWNGGGQNRMNEDIESELHRAFPGEYTENRRGLTLRKNVYLEYGEKFDWPDRSADKRDVRFCMGLRDQIGVLFDGTVVPCCLDADGSMPLGNIFTDEPEDILSSAKAKAIYDGFSNGHAAEELCRHCGYAEKFTKNGK